PNATASDPDNDLASGSLTVTSTAGDTNDVLAIVNAGTGAGQVGIAGSSVTYGGTTVGTWSGGTGSTALSVAFNSAATSAAVQAVAEAISFMNTSGTPVTG